jgi:hypothetical protein
MEVVLASVERMAVWCGRTVVEEAGGRALLGRRKGIRGQDREGERWPPPRRGPGMSDKSQRWLCPVQCQDFGIFWVRSLDEALEKKNVLVS